MKITIINGSARKGNSAAAIEAIMHGAKEHHTIDLIQADKVDMAFCKGCNACECYKGCVDKDETNATIDRIAAADMILFVTPVYWWGMTAQLKLIIDKCYCRGAQLKGKKIGVVVVGGAPVESTQYRLIKEQFTCMAEYLAWDTVFYQSISATGTDDLKNDRARMEQLTRMGAEL